MPQAPSGNVTFLFTDIEGSAKLTQTYPETYQKILQKHDAILEEIIHSQNGFVFKKAGDSFCASFAKTSDAANAAIEIQNKIIDEFKNDSELKVRMGLHRGEAEFINNDYLGYVTLSLVQRIMSVANGGQILLTQEAHNDLETKPANNISFKDFGKRKLKDIILPEHIYQIVSKNLPSDFTESRMFKTSKFLCVLCEPLRLCLKAFLGCQS